MVHSLQKKQGEHGANVAFSSEMSCYRCANGFAGI